MSTRKLAIGEFYSVRYIDRSWANPKVYDLVGRFIGENYAGQLLFDLRPVAGTAMVGKSEFVEATPAPHGTMHVKLPKRVRT